MKNEIYIENTVTEDKKGPFVEMDDAKDMAEAWTDRGQDVMIHEVLDGEIQRSWTFDGEEMEETSDFEGDPWIMDEEDVDEEDVILPDE